MRERKEGRRGGTNYKEGVRERRGWTARQGEARQGEVRQGKVN